MIFHDTFEQPSRSTTKKQSAATIVALGMAAVEMTERGNNTTDTSDTELNKNEKISEVPQGRE